MIRVVDVATGFVFEAVDATVLHVRRIVGALCTAVGRTRREVGDLAWDYSDLAGSVRLSARRTRTSTGHDGQALRSEYVADVISIDRMARSSGRAKPP